MINTALETIQAVAHHAVDNPPAPRAVPDPPPAASLAGLLPRLGRMLLRLLLAGASPDDRLRIFPRALAAYLPLLGLDWLPADPRAIPVPSDRVVARLDLLRQERAARARLRSAVARHSGPRPVPPDRPPENRLAAALGLESTAEPEELWQDLLDLTSETLETFIAYGHQEGVVRCAALIDLLAECAPRTKPAA